jgi:DNA-binding GntR family transcriptional regulator
MDTNQIAPIRITNLPEVIVDRLRKAIITNELKSGERLPEVTLSTQLGVSRSPVREALQILKADGLVVESHNRGCCVWNPTLTDVDEIFSLRAMIETLASEWLINHITDEDIQNLETMIAEQRRAIENNDLFLVIESDKRFHEYLVNRSNHSRLKELWSRIMWQWEVLIYRRARHDPAQVVPTAITDHTAIVDALKTHNLARMSELHRAINIIVATNIKDVIAQEPR